MQFETRQNVGTRQQLNLAPKIIQSMEILQLSLPALQEKLEHELESNFALEMEQQDLDLEVVEDESSQEEEFARLEEFEEQNETNLNESPPKSSNLNQENDLKSHTLANIRAKEQSLSEILENQWSFAEVVEQVRFNGKFLISFIDTDGFITLPDSDLINKFKEEFKGKELTKKELEEAFLALQRWLDPPGIAARSLQQSLLIQVETYEPEDPECWSDVKSLISKHLDDLVENRLPKISASTGLSIERVKSAIGKMHELTLSPARLIASESALPVIPDATIVYDSQADEYIVGINEGNLPPLRVSREYEKLAKDTKANEETLKFIHRNINAARWIVDAVSQRKATLHKIISLAAERQRDFLDQGEAYLRPLPMVEAADILGIHVATVSRAVADKWIQTPRGIFPFRKFFSGGTYSESSGEMSWEAVKIRLKEIVDSEDKAKPLSDEGIASHLRDQGITIARRTVVKYRQQLGIPAARIRKKF